MTTTPKHKKGVGVRVHAVYIEVTTPNAARHNASYWESQQARTFGIFAKARRISGACQMTGDHLAFYVFRGLGRAEVIDGTLPRTSFLFPLLMRFCICKQHSFYLLYKKKYYYVTFSSFTLDTCIDVAVTIWSHQYMGHGGRLTASLVLIDWSKNSERVMNGAGYEHAANATRLN